MNSRRPGPDIIVAAIVAAIFAVSAGVLLSPIAIRALSRAGEINAYLEPYLQFMATLAIVNALLVLALVPICRRTSGWIAKASIWVTVAFSTLLVTEVGAAVSVKMILNDQHVGSRFTNGFEFSPSLGFVLKPNFKFQLSTGELTHTRDGYRGPEATGQGSAERKTVLMIGGSSTYDLGLPDHHTWPVKLNEIFPKEIRALNLGVPGHSTAEHVTLTALTAWKYNPDVIIFYVGWNDIRSSHVNESTDYSRFHKKRMLHNFAITEPTAFFALTYLLKKIVARLDETSLYRLTEIEIDPEPLETVDQELLETYLHNVRMLVTITRGIGAIPVFVPQILNEHRLTSEQPYGWIPRVPQRSVPKILAVFNEAMMKTASEEGALVVSDVLDVDWQDADFVDRGHFSPRGAKRFACALAAGLVERGVIGPLGETTQNFSVSCDSIVSLPVNGRI